MAGLDELISEAADTFGLGQKSGLLFAELLRLMTNPRLGGLAGFLDRFRDAGYEDVVASWLARSKPLPILTAPVERVLGAYTIDRIAVNVGATYATVGSAIAYFLPRIVGVLAPEGRVPAAPPAEVRSLLGLPELPSESVKLAVKEAGSGLGKWWWLLLLVPLLLGLGWYVLRDRPEPGAPPPAAVQQPSSTPSPTAAKPAQLTLRNTDGKIDYRGVVADEAARAGILAALASVFGEANITGTIALDPATGRAPWLAQLKPALETLNVSGAEVQFEGASARLGGWLTDAERTSLLAALHSLFGTTVDLGDLGDPAAEAAKSALDRTQAALGALPSSFTGEQLVQALNLAILNFASGSAALPADATPFLDQAAAAMQRAPAGTRIEISGHTDNTGDPQANLALSEARAKAVREALIGRGVPAEMLVAKGFGSSRPIAPNDTAYGRFQNRRIAFSVVP